MTNYEQRLEEDREFIVPGKYDVYQFGVDSFMFAATYLKDDRKYLSPENIKFYGDVLGGLVNDERVTFTYGEDPRACEKRIVLLGRCPCCLPLFYDDEHFVGSIASLKAEQKLILVDLFGQSVERSRDCFKDWSEDPFSFGIQRLFDYYPSGRSPTRGDISMWRFTHESFSKYQVKPDISVAPDEAAEEVVNRIVGYFG